MTNQLMTALLWVIAIAHLMTSIILRTFVLAVYYEFTKETPRLATDTPVRVPLSVAVTEETPVVNLVAKPRPVRRRKFTAKFAA